MRNRPLHLLLALLLVATAGCGSINSQGPWQRTMSAFARGFGTPSAAIERGLVLTQPHTVGDGLEQEVMLFSKLRNSITTVRFSASDSMAVRDAVGAGTVLTITAGTPLPPTGGMQVLQATAWRANNDTPDVVVDALFRNLPTILSVLLPAALAEPAPVATRVVTLRAPAPEPITRLMPDPYCKTLLGEYHAGAVGVRSSLEAAGVPRNLLAALYDDESVVNYLLEKEIP